MALDNNNRYDANRQRQIDKAMCKPGYTWLEMPWKDSGGKCVPSGALVNDRIEKKRGQQSVDSSNNQMNGPASQQSSLASSADGIISGELQARQVQAPASQSTNTAMKATQLQQLGKDIKKKSAAASQRTALDLM